MQISNNHTQFSPNFQGIRVQLSRMNQLQKNAANSIADSLGYMDEYQEAANMGVDVIFHAIDKAANKVKVSFLDADSDMFYKFKSTGKPVFNSFRTYDRHLDVVDKICRTLRKISQNKYKVEETDYEKILKGETDMAKLDPTANDEFIKISKELDNSEALLNLSIDRELAERQREVGIHKNEAF